MEKLVLSTTVMIVIFVVTVNGSEWIYGDTRTEPGELNADPGVFLNIFPTLTAPVTGYISIVKFHSARPGDVMVSFWENTEDEVFALVAMVPISADGTGLEEFIPKDDVLVFEGNALGIHYTDSEAEGVIYYEDVRKDNRNDIPVYPVYDINSQGSFSIGDTIDMAGHFRNEDDGKNVAVHVKILSLDSVTHEVGTTDDVTTGTAQTLPDLICETLKADNRTEPNEMNKDPGNWFNLFPTLAVPRSGHVSSVSFYAEQAGDVSVSFWHRTDENEYSLAAIVPVTSTGPGLQTVIPEEITYVHQGDVLGIFYHDEDADGVIYYEFYDGDVRFDVALYEFYSKDIQGEWDVGHHVDLSAAKHATDESQGRNVALHVEICSEVSDELTTEEFTTFQPTTEFETTEDYGLICDSLSPDIRPTPGKMNRLPGNWFNLFPTLQLPQSGHITNVKYFAGRAGDVVVSFWHQIGENEYSMSSYLQLTSDGPGFHVYHPKDTVNVEEGDVLGIHYLSDDDDDGVIYYEFESEDAHTDDVPVYPAFTKDIQGDWAPGKTVEFSSSDFKGIENNARRNVAIQIHLCDEVTEATTSLYEDLVCELLAPDTRPEPGEMNRDPGTWFNLFPTLSIPLSGHVTKIKYFAARPGDVEISFWKRTEDREFTLDSHIPITATETGLQVHIPDEQVYVEQGDVLGIFYHSGEDGVIYYEFANEDVHTEGVPVYPVFAKDIRGIWEAGKVVEFSAEDYHDAEKARNIALQVHICAEDIEQTTQDNEVSCEAVHPDNRPELERMNLEPGSWINIFTTLTMPRSGYVTEVKYFAYQSGDVVVSFWHESSSGVFELEAQIPITASAGLHVFYPDDKSVFVKEGAMLAIHYLDEDALGVIFYEDSEEPSSVDGIELHPTINQAIHGDWQIGHVIDLSDGLGNMKQRNVAVHLTICGIEEEEEEEEEEIFDEEVICSVLHAVNITELDELNQEPGKHMNIFPTIHVPQSGQITRIKYYAAVIGDVVVSFWHVIDEAGVFELAAQVDIHVTSPGLGILEPIENIYVHDTSVLGIHYHDDDGEGVIYYENARVENHNVDIPVYPVFSKGLHGNFSLGSIANLTNHYNPVESGKAAALHIEICAPECGFTENGTYSDVCLQEWWFEAGCFIDGYSSPQNSVSDVHRWNELNVRQVKDDMESHFFSAMEGNDVYPKKCFGNNLCEVIKADNRTKPQAMNHDPGRYLNIFSTLRVPMSGKVSSIRFFALREGEFIVSFWNETENGIFTLGAKIHVNASEGYQAFYPEEVVHVKEGYALGIFYAVDEGPGVISFECTCVDEPRQPVPLYPVYCSDLQTDFSIGKTLDLTDVYQDVDEGKNVAIHVEICAMCETVKADNRSHPGEMNLAPRRWLNLFPTLSMPYQGRIAEIEYFAAFAGDFTVSFWTEIEEHRYILSSQVNIHADSTGLHTFKPEENIYVSENDVFAIHYPNDEVENGVVYYESAKDSRLVDEISIYPVYSADIVGEWEVGHELSLAEYYNSVDEGKNVAIHITVCEYNCDMYNNGPFDKDCFEIWWIATGCNEDGTASPFNNAEKIAYWNTLDIEGVRADMYEYFARATEDEYYSETCWGNTSRPSAPENCTGADCFCNGTFYGGSGGAYSEVYPNFGEMVTGFRVCQSANSNVNDIAAGLDVYFSDDTQGSILGCNSRLDPYDLVSLADGERITEVTVWYGTSNGWGVTVIEGLQFVSNTDETYGPYGLTNGTAATENGLALVGFLGRSGMALDGIAFLWEACQQ